MVNFVYLVGDRVTGEAVIIDPAYGVDELVGILAADDMTCVGALATHYHADHVGGDMMGFPVEGITRLLELAPVPVHVQADETPWLTRTTGVTPDELVVHAGGDVVQVGAVPITLIHTPATPRAASASWWTAGSSPGTPCSSTGAAAPTSPAAIPTALYESLTTRLAAVPDDTVLYPGHLYSPEPSATMGDTRSNNYVFRLPLPRAVDDHVRSMSRTGGSPRHLTMPG